MIDQLPIYALCYGLGWFPIYYLYRKIESLIPFSLKKSTVVFSLFPFVHLIYIALEICRGYWLMHIVHEWLVYDLDLILGVMLFLLAIGYPLYLTKHYRTRIWLSILGIYSYLFPMFFWLVPLILIIMFFLGQRTVVSYGVLGVGFLIIGFVQGGNSLYVLLYFGLMVYLLVKSYFDSHVYVKR